MRDERRRTLRVFHDYGAPWPLWEGTGMTPSDYGLSADLSDRLRECGDLFERHYRYDTGWADAQHRVAYADGMRQAVAILRREVPPDVEVRDEHGWCLGDPEREP